ncbi:hypothetical protein BX659_10241 [Orenia metallireducens]|jgi:hypothetical protein|uniref:Uncharacterized protein n=1 Tax=Orenia metallireducens TaxID=1413210 RepID=A0A285F250_9FIRM|nr:hypothetical protein [Orenia metallireducens]PRX34726.1 hypothetical protein BX659_10241 [Orenia metallireducens]SNY05365.1 hypothetical protein SAMN06265827_10141 [Orenia metallireducens]
MWIKKRVSKYRFAKVRTYQEALEKTTNILKNKFGDNKVFLSEEEDKQGNKHFFLKANLKKEEAEKFNTIYNELTSIFFSGRVNQPIEF